ncbi:PHP domain-containing protein [Marinobacterium sp. YM272]|uniref:PHP domain-containing protein n=1 Tax=Marinobacterium sp. YM272 TaxID=3421654 RepID=UPI003D7FD30A
MKQYAGYDLHTHSTASDGALAPAALVRAAYEAGVRQLALTDHDTLAGLDEAAREASGYEDMQFYPGVELTCIWRGRVIHLLGVGIDPQAPVFVDYMKELRCLRAARAEKIAERLVKKGLPDILEAARKIAGSGQIGRPHFAQALIDKGVVTTAQQAFDLWLGAGKAGDVKAEWPSLEEAVHLVKSASGYALVAHPTKYNMTFTRLRELMDAVIQAGGDGLEVSYPGVTPNHLRDLLNLADRKSLLVSAGSDFHSPAQRWTALGRFSAFTSSRHLLSCL